MPPQYNCAKRRYSHVAPLVLKNNVQYVKIINVAVSVKKDHSSNLMYQFSHKYSDMLLG